MRSRTLACLAVFALALAAAAQDSTQTNWTALALAREGDKYLDAKARGKIVDLHSDKSVGGLTPSTWHITYFNPTIMLKRTEIEFVSGRKTELSHPNGMSGWLSGTKVLQTRKIRMDSDRALALASKEPNLKGLNLQASQVWLEATTIGPAWKIRLWSDKPEAVADIKIATRDGKIIESTVRYGSAILTKER